MSNIQPPLLQAVWEDLDRDVKEFVEAKWNYEQARYHLEVARQRFGATKKVASEVLTGEDWRMWGGEHPEVRYVGMSIGDAISEMLMDLAFTQAGDFVEGKVESFKPGMVQDGIFTNLERGGFEFKGLTPHREVHAALIHLKAVEQREFGYTSVDAQAALEWTQDRYGKKEDGETEG